MINCKGKYITVGDIKEYLLEKHPELVLISDWSIRLILRSKLKYSYKKLWYMMRRSLNSESIRSFYESAFTQLQLENLGYELIFIDEFSINFRQRTTYGWASIGKKGFIDTDEEKFDMSFMVGFSKQKFYGIVGTSSSNNSNSFLRFIKHVIEYRVNILKIINWKHIIVWYNASLHTSKEVREFIENTK